MVVACDASRLVRFPPDRPQGRPVVFAHRGARAELPENTIPAFELALEVGADAIETDVHLTRDGEVIVFHDDDGRRVAGMNARVADTPLAQLRRWDVGFAFVSSDGRRPFVGQGFHAPTLAEVLRAFPHTAFNVDVKPGTREAAAATIRVVRDHGAEARVLLTSFDARGVQHLRDLGYRGPTGSGVRDVLAFLARPSWSLRPGALAGDALQIPYRLGAWSVPLAPIAARCRRAGCRLDVFTVNDRADAVRVARAGVDGIMTDDPRAIVSVVRA